MKLLSKTAILAILERIHRHWLLLASWQTGMKEVVASLSGLEPS